MNRAGLGQGRQGNRGKENENGSLQPHRKEQWVIQPKARGAFVVAMVEVLDVYPHEQSDRKHTFAIAPRAARRHAAPTRRKGRSTWFPPSPAASVLFLCKPRWRKNRTRLLRSRNFSTCWRSRVPSSPSMRWAASAKPPRKSWTKKADYVLAPKGDHGSPHEDVEVFAAKRKAKGFKDIKISRHESVDGDHGHVETRALQ